MADGWKRKMTSCLNEIFCCFDFRSNFLVLISILLNIGKEKMISGLNEIQSVFHFSSAF